MNCPFACALVFGQLPGQALSSTPMYKTNSGFIYSPSDLISFLQNECVTWLNRYDLERPGELTRDNPDEQDALIREVGIQHEQTILEQTKSTAEVKTIAPGKQAFQRTVAAMREGHAVIYQARLEDGSFAGVADFLFRIEEPSEWGAWRYEVWDTKLARSMKPYYAVQLCCYADMLEAVQGCRSGHAGIILGTGDKRPLRLPDYWFYYQAVKQSFLDQQNSFNPEIPPFFNGMSDYGPWTGYVEQRLKDRGDLSLIANIRSVQVKKLRLAGINTSAELAERSDRVVPKMEQATFSRLSAQARLQLASVPGQAPAFEILPHEAGSRNGLALLPPASPQDVCFDIEGYPLVEGGLEYLLGVTCRDQGGLKFKDWWAHNEQQERASFESFVQWVHRRWKEDPSMHVYHYAPYEITALKRLICRYAICEEEVDELLRNNVFIDLYAVVRQSMLIGEPKYSLKNVEHIYLPKRDGEVKSAGDSIVYYHRWRMAPDGEDCHSSPTLKFIRDYNEKDCNSTWYLLDWLRNQQENNACTYVPPQDSQELAEQTTARSALSKAMLAEALDRADQDPEKWRVHELLAHLLEFHRREQKAQWWAHFERAAMTEQELMDDPACLAGLERTALEPAASKQSFVYEYNFPSRNQNYGRGRIATCHLILASG